MRSASRFAQAASTKRKAIRRDRRSALDMFTPRQLDSRSTLRQFSKRACRPRAGSASRRGASPASVYAASSRRRSRRWRGKPETGVGPVLVRHAVVEVVGEELVGRLHADVVAARRVGEVAGQVRQLAEHRGEFGEREQVAVRVERRLALVDERDRRGRVRTSRLVQVVDEVEERVRVVRPAAARG